VLTEELVAGLQVLVACDFERGVLQVLDVTQRLGDARHVDDTLAERDRAHPAPVQFPTAVFPVRAEVLPVDVADPVAEGLGELDGVGTAQPGVAGVEVDADRLLVTQFVEQGRHPVDRVGQSPVGFDQQLDVQSLGETDGLVEFLGHGEQLLVPGQVLAPLRRRVTFGGDDVVDAHAVGEADRLRDLRSPVPTRRARVQQVRVGADASRRQAVSLELPPDVDGIVVQAHRRRETELPAQEAAGVVVGHVGVLEAHIGDARELVVERLERVDEGETSHVHNARQFDGPADSGSDDAHSVRILIRLGRANVDVSRATVTDDGGWCWFQDPRALRHRGAHDRTYVGWITRSGDVCVGQYDHDDGAVATATLHADYEADDHDDPTVAVRPDGRLVVFYTRHGGPSVDYRVSTDPESVASFEPERHVEPGPETAVTYPNPRWIGGDLHLFLRNAGSVVDVVSPDGGETWHEQRELVTTGGEGWCVYAKVSRVRDGEVNLGLTHAIGGGDDPHRHVRHARFDGDALRASGGSVLGRVSDGSLPVAIDETTPVFDSGATGDDAWIWDCATSGGVPQLTYVQLVSPDDHRYRYARWTGDDWADELLCHGGAHVVAGADNPERYYSGGVVLDHDSPGVCYASVGSHDSSALVRFERVGGGSPEGHGDWHREQVAPADAQNLRPVVPWNRHSDLRVCWLRGSYTYYAPREARDDAAAFETAIVGEGVDSGDGGG